MTRAAEPHAPVGHIQLVEALFEPLVAVVRARNEVVEGEGFVAGAHGAVVGFGGFSKNAHNLLILSAKSLEARFSRRFWINLLEGALEGSRRKLEPPLPFKITFTCFLDLFAEGILELPPC